MHRPFVGTAWPKACHGGSSRYLEDGAVKTLRCEMPKLKTKSGAKKRFKLTAKGKVKHGQAGKRHHLIRHTNDQIRDLRGTSVLSSSETQRIKRWMPYA